MATGAQFNRNKTWDDEKLTDTDLNAEFDNILNNLDAAGLGSGDTSASHARQTKNPGTYASPNVADTLQDDIQHLRYIIGAMIGGPNSSHLDTISTTLTSASAASSVPVLNFDFEGKHEGAATAPEAYARMINKGAIINAASLSSADFVAADLDTDNVKYGKYSYAFGSGNILGCPGIGGNPLKASLSAWVKGMAAGDYIAYNPLLGIELYIDGSAKLVAKVTEKIASTEDDKNTVSVTGDDYVNYPTDMAAEFKLASLSYVLNDVDGASSDQLNISWDGTLDTSVNLSSQDLDINAGDGGVWFLGARRNDPTWDHKWAASDLPTAHSDAVWASSGTPNGTVSNGVLNIATSGSNRGEYIITAGPSALVDATQQTLEWKCRINSVSDTTANDISSAYLPSVVRYRDDSADRQVLVKIYTDHIDVLFSDVEIYGTIYGDFSDWHSFRLTSETGSYTTKLYIDGICVFSEDNGVSDTTSGDAIAFGDAETTSGFNSDSDWEYFYICASEAAPPLAANTQGYMDDFGILGGLITTGNLQSLSSAPFLSVFGQSEVLGPYMRFGFNGYQGTTEPSLPHSTYEWEDLDNHVYYIQGDGVTPITLCFSAGVDFNSSASDEIHCAIDINGEIEGKQAEYAFNRFSHAHTGVRAFWVSSGNAIFNVHTQRTVVLPPGLNAIKPCMYNGDNAVNADVKLYVSHFEFIQGNVKRLGK